MSNKIVIIKTGNTIPSLLAQQEDFEDWFVQGTGLQSSRFICSAVDKGEVLPDIDEIGAAIVTGSPAYVTDLAHWNQTAAEYLREMHIQRKPILGVCYGHQLLAWAFGGEVGFHPQGREIGTVDVELTEAAKSDELFAEMPSEFIAQASHQQSILALPADAVLLAKNDFDAHHAFRLGTSTWGVQFHPEFSASVMRAYITERSDDISKEGIDVQGLLGEVAPTPAAASLLKQFVALVDR
jgi:GMP synthase (glutamine-hydrolysing)